MTATSPRLDPRLAAATVSLDDPRLPAAETWRRVCVFAEGLELARPGYDTIRRIVMAHRRGEEELRGLLKPVVADLFRGRLSPWALDRMIEAQSAARSRREATGR